MLRRKRLWKRLGALNPERPNSLWKNHWLKCGCSMCQYEQYLKYQENKRIRNLAKRIIAYELEQ